MFRNYFITTIRSFWRNKMFTLINIAGLAIGISASLVIYLIVRHEFSYESFLKDKDSTYRVVTVMHFPDMEFKNGGVPGPLPAAAKAEIPAIESSTNFYMPGPASVTINSKNDKNKTFRKQENIVFADDQYFQFINYEWLAGSASQALTAPNRVVLTASRAHLYFPGEDLEKIIGQSIIYDDTTYTIVTGVVQDISSLTDLSFKEFVSLPTIINRLKTQNGYDEWGSVSSSTQYLVKLKTGSDTAAISGQLKAIREKHKKNAYLDTDHFLQPIEDVHFNADFNSINQPKAHKPTLYGLLAVAAFLLLLGCINFINLTTAHASKRAKEIGIRKTMGSSKKALVIQFLSETFLLTLFAAILSLALTPVILKIFADFIPDNLQVNFLQQPHILVFILIITAVVTLLSGFYPALVLSKYKPVTVLKNVTTNDRSTSRSTWVRKTLTVSQFAIAQFFIIATVVVGKQIYFSMHKDMGFKKDAILLVHTPYNFHQPDQKQFILQQKLKSIPDIEQISLAGSAPASNSTSSTTMNFIKDGKEIETTVEIKQADENYFDLYHMKLIAGRNLEESDTAKEYVVNEHYAKYLGFKDPGEIVGQFISRGDQKYPVVGVLADFNTKSVHTAITPLVYTNERNQQHDFHIALPVHAMENWNKTIKAIETNYRQVYPEADFSYQFFDESIAEFYKREQHISSLLRWSTGLTIFISCLGLLGLVIFTTTQRTKEIGVRKVLGASVSQLVALLSKDFVQLVLLAFLLAAPLAWWATHKWLENFAYRTTVNWWIFLLCGLGMLFIALFTLSFQTIRSAISNPVDSLRTE